MPELPEVEVSRQGLLPHLPGQTIVGAVVRTIAIDLIGPMPIAVGQSYTIRVRVEGDNLNGAKPTLWVDGGVGALGSNDRLTFTASGTGEIRAQLYGVQGSLSVDVP